MVRRSLVHVALVTGIGTALAAAAAGAAREAIERGDSAWERRADGRRGLRADPAPIGEAVAAYEAALEAEPRNLEARWKLMRALYFLGEYALDDREATLEAYDRARQLGEEGLDQLAEAAGGRRELDRKEPDEIARLLAGEPEAVAVYYWTAASWGLWGRHRGAIAAVRQGVAGKVRDYAEIVVALDEGFENGGGHRVLGRLHAEAPRIPLITGWVDHQAAIRHLERSLEIYPRSIVTRLYLVEALYEHDRSRRGEALERLRRLVDSPPHPDYLLEDLAALADARELLEELSE